jgi:hypothetical protein
LEAQFDRAQRAGQHRAGDITTGFSGNGTRLYASILNASSGDLQFLRTANPFFRPDDDRFEAAPAAISPSQSRCGRGTKRPINRRHDWLWRKTATVTNR